MRTAGAAVLAALALAAPVAAQEDCEFLPGTGNVRGVTIGESRITYIATPNLACEGGVSIQADSAVVFQSSAFTQLFGDVRFEDAERRLRSREAQYFDRVGRLQAQGDVELVRKLDGSVVRGDDLVYLPRTPDRAERLTVNGDRASATLVVEPDTAAAGEPTPERAAPDTAVTYDVVADRIVLEGETGFVATGRGRPVEIVRDSLRAFGDSVDYDEAGGLLALREDARMTGSGYDLTGQTIDVLLPGQDVREVVADGDAVLASEDVHLTASRIRLFLEAGTLERLVAMPGAAAESEAVAEAAPEADEPVPVAPPEEGVEAPLAATGAEAAAPRARARAETFDLEADSIEVLAPGEVLERLVAVGRARGESSARDSLNTPETPPVARRDWIEGDTIVATFGRAAGADTTAYTLDRLEARVAARSLYRLEPSDSAAAGSARLAVHYVTGDEIVIDMEAGEVEHMRVAGPTRGLHLEPRAPGAVPGPAESAPPADTTETADTVGAGDPDPATASPPPGAAVRPDERWRDPALRRDPPARLRGRGRT